MPAPVFPIYLHTGDIHGEVHRVSEMIEKNTKINNLGVPVLCIGHQGQFDAYVHRELKRLKQEYPQINYAVVLAYMPGIKTEYDDYSDTMLPEGIEAVHTHYAISWRNNWMLRQSEYVVTYITHSWGGAFQYAEKAKQQKRNVINIAE